MNELVRCRPCGYVMKAHKLGEVCPACGLPRKVFEPYREQVSTNRLMILGFDLHPIAIHLSQTFVGLISLLIVITMISKDIYYDTLVAVINFCIYLLPFSLALAIITGLIDGLTRFKSLKTPLLRMKLLMSFSLLILSVAMFITTEPGNFNYLTLVLSLAALICAIMLGLWGKKLITVILPGTYPQKKGNKNKKESDS